MTRTNSLWWAASLGAVLGVACGGSPKQPAGAAAGAAGSATGAGDAGGAGAAAVVFAPGDLVISDVTVVPMSKDGELAHRSVVVRGDRIAAVVPSAGLAVPAGVTAIDGRGKWLMPGL